MDTPRNQSPRPAPRLDFFAHGPDAMRAMGALERRIAQSDLEPSLVELVRLRVSQINGCASCVAPQLVDLTLAVNAINAWNRFAIAFRKLPS